MNPTRSSRRSRLAACAAVVMLSGALRVASATSLGGVVSAQLFAVNLTVSPSFATVVMADDFTSVGPLSGRTPQSVGTGVWIQIGGNWATAGGAVNPPNSANALVLYNAESANVEVQDSLTIRGKSRTGLVVRSSSTGSTFLNAFVTELGVVAIEKVVSGSRTTLVSTTVVLPATAFRFGFRVSGQVATVTLNGAAVCTYTLTTAEQIAFGAQTYIGLSAANSGNEIHDDFAVVT